MKHEKFKEFVMHKWGQHFGSALDKSFGLIVCLKQWNVDVFGHLKQRKARLRARLAGIHKALCNSPNKFLS